VLGSVAEWLTQVITFPLAVVPHDGHDRTGGPILVGIDGSPQSGLALDWAIGLADRLRRRVHALYAVAPRGAAQEAAAAGREPGIDAVHREIARARSEARAAHVVLYLTECAEHPVTALATRADDENAEAIVVGARGFGQFGELTIGRVPRQLLHVAHRPVVIIPS
jgi:nucleotide-binding universal stress UspA family protein